MRALTGLVSVAASTCNPPTSLAHGQVRLGRGGIIAAFTCEEGYTLQGTGIAVCVAGRWSTPVPTCVSDDPDATPTTDTPTTATPTTAPPRPGRRRQRGPGSRRGRQRERRPTSTTTEAPSVEQRQQDQHVITAYNVVESSSTLKDHMKHTKVKGHTKQTREEEEDNKRWRKRRNRR
ncbi:complement decay-accelerating factor transmembrane isoform-like [Penaeus chinensis]|uniref:complement decay-accelerating factor transmembrane isoform-like n=1 Tax=Penaeus chinensis TaxID=139456 RepID=UPI001FB7B9B1|nr:complement decay-accelerating factor transmembrane isoform-like [Penaeus chinensis]